MTLYEMEQRYRTFLDMAEEGELSEDALNDMREYLLEDIGGKLEGYGCVLRQLEADKEAVKTEKMRLALKQAQLEKNIDRIREAMKGAMLLTDQKKIKTALFTFSTTTRLKAFVDVEESKIPPQWQKVTIKADTKGIEEFLKAGNEVPWAHLEQVQSLTVR